jgi:hypothetical protein
MRLLKFLAYNCNKWHNCAFNIANILLLSLAFSMDYYKQLHSEKPMHDVNNRNDCYTLDYIDWHPISYSITCAVNLV